VIARRVETEWLDVLPPGDPRAQRSRRELTRVNALMANAGIVAAELRAMGKVPREIADLGAGDGRFALRLARALGTPPAGARLTLVDRQDVVDQASRKGLEALGWRVESVQADVAEWLASPAAARESMVANLFLHHFDDAPLARLLALIAQRTRRFVACEPRRSALAATGARLLGAIGCGEVTRHDAVLSVRAGFAGAELRDLWTPEAGWIVQEGPRGLFSHVLRAHRP
jgi:hypothetical protein